MTGSSGAPLFVLLLCRCRRPAREEIESLTRRRVRFGVVDEHRLTGIAGHRERLEVEREVTNYWMVEAFHAGAMELHVVCCPSRSERLAAGREFADQIGEPLVVWVT